MQNPIEGVNILYIIGVIKSETWKALYYLSV